MCLIKENYSLMLDVSILLPWDRQENIIKDLRGVIKVLAQLQGFVQDSFVYQWIIER